MTPARTCTGPKCREADKASYGQEFSREALLDLLHRLPANFDRAMFEAPQKLAWDE